MNLAFAPHLIKFPKPYRHTLGETIGRNMLSLLEHVFEANAMPRPLREPPLIKAVATCELLKLLVRMSLELTLIESTPYFQVTGFLNEIGKMLNGWIGYVRSTPNEQNKPPTQQPQSAHPTTDSDSPSRSS